MKPSRWGTGAALAAVLLIASGCGGPERPPHIILVTLDCLRHDRLAAYGGPEDLTPALNGLAERGTVFVNAFTASGTTFPSHATMLTGLYPRMHGVRSNRFQLSEVFQTVPELLSERGYRTGAFVSFRQMVVRAGLGQGFEARSDTEDDEFSREHGRFGERGIFRDGAETTRLATEWLEGLGEQSPEGPVFLWLHLYEPHTPYRLNDWSRERLGDYDGPLADGAGIDYLRGEGRRLVLESERGRRALQILYDGEVHKMDRHVGQLLEALRALALLEDAVVIVASDHGQSLGEHGQLGHGPTVREDVIRIPMLIADFRNSARHRVEANVGTVDLAPTMLALAGVEHQTQWQGRDLSGSLRHGRLEPAPYFAEVAYQENAEDWYHPDQIAVYDGGLKLAYNPGSFQLFDLRSDPHALEPLDPGAHPTVADYLLGLAQDYLARETTPQRADLTEHDLQTLRSLGYIQ